MRKPSGRNTVRRLAERGSYDKATIYDIIDEALICHVGIADESQPFVIPTLHARDGDRILFHGLKGGRLLKHIQSGGEICVTIPPEVRASAPADDPAPTQDLDAPAHTCAYRRGRG